MIDQERLQPHSSEPTFESMKRLVETSNKIQKEHQIKILKQNNGKISTLEIEEEKHKTSAASSFFRPPDELAEICLTSHTHYKLEEEGFDPKYSLFFSESDIDNLFGTGPPGEKEEYLGSFFIPNQYGITFIVDSALFDTQKSRQQGTFWILKGQTDEKLGWITSLKMDSVKTDGKMSLHAYNFLYGIVFDLVFMPYSQLDSISQGKKIELTDVLLRKGLSSIIEGTPFSTTAKHHSLLEVISSTKQLVRKKLDHQP